MTHTKSKAIRAAYEQYKRSNSTELWQVYGRYSELKRHALALCRLLEIEYFGYNGRIISHNTMCFSYGFIGSAPETGEMAFFWITRDYDRYILIDELERGC